MLSPDQIDLNMLSIFDAVVEAGSFTAAAHRPARPVAPDDAVDSDLDELEAAVAARADSLEAFGRHLRDWLHELRRCSARPQAAAAIAEEPGLLRGRFAGGHVADAEAVGA